MGGEHYGLGKCDRGSPFVKQIIQKIRFRVINALPDYFEKIPGERNSSRKSSVSNFRTTSIPTVS